MSRPDARLVTVLLLASLALGVLLGFYRWLPEPSLLTVLTPTIETLVIVALAWFGSRFKTRHRHLLALLALITASLAVFGVGEGFYQAIFRREFVPWTDLAFLPALFNMVFETSAFEQTLLVVLPVALLILAITFLALFLLRVLRSGFARAGATETAIVSGVLLVLVASHGIVSYAHARDGPSTSEAPPLLTARALRQTRPPGEEEPAPVVQNRVVQKPAAHEPSYAFPYLRDRDVHFFVVESYGHTIVSDPAHRSLIEPVYARLEQRLRDENYWSYTSFLVSPAFGGRSWLADATMLTGTFIDSQHKYETIIESGSRNLTHILGDAGYHRVLAAPGTYEADTEWREFYQFDQYLFRYDFDYRGPFVSFGAMPDQFLIHRANQEVSSGDRPLFLQYLLVSSHVPFDRLPPYVEDWSRLGDGSIFNELPIRTFDNNWLTGSEYPEGYVASIEYTLTSIVDFLGHLDDEALVVIVGDHQPRIPISAPDSTFSVPVHVLSRDRSLIEPFAHYDFVRGFAPDPRLARDPDTHPGMDRLLEMLLDVSRGITAAYDHVQP